MFQSARPQLTNSEDRRAQNFVADLKQHLALCEEVMELTANESQALSEQSAYEPFDFFRRRKELLPRLDKSLAALRGWRQAWQNMNPTERAGCPEIKPLFQAAQSLLMKVLLLDRENQQAMLRRGLVPPRHLPSSAGQQPHCVADLYRRHAAPVGA
jgi:hypothetical protein